MAEPELAEIWTEEVHKPSVFNSRLIETRDRDWLNYLDVRVMTGTIISSGDIPPC